MPDLGTYTATVLGAYGVSIVLIGALVVMSLYRARRVKAALEREEKRRG